MRPCIHIRQREDGSRQAGTLRKQRHSGAHLHSGAPKRLDVLGAYLQWNTMWDSSSGVPPPHSLHMPAAAARAPVVSPPLLPLPWPSPLLPLFLPVPASAMPTSVSQVIHGFDVDCCGGALDGARVMVTAGPARAQVALRARAALHPRQCQRRGRGRACLSSQKVEVVTKL